MRRIGLVIALGVLSSVVMSVPAERRTGADQLLAAPPDATTVEDKRTDGWTLFRGNPLQTGVAVGKLPDKLVELWKCETKDAIEGAPAIQGGVVYFGSLDENVYALSLADGKEKWKYKGGPFKASPSIHEGCIYIGDSDGIFHCVDAAQGKQKWTFKTDGEITSSANFSKDLILFGSYDESLYCLSKDGKQKWQFKTQGPVNGAPAVTDGKTFVAGCDSAIHVIDIAKGEELASVTLTGQAAATAAVVGDQLYVGNMANDLQAVDLKKREVAWTFTPLKNAQPFFGSAAATDQIIVAGNRNKRLYAIDRKSGKEIWNFPTGGRIDSSPVILGDRVYVGSLDNNLYVIDLKTGRQLQKVELDSSVTGSPAIADGRLLIGTQKGTLYCFGEKK